MKWYITFSYKNMLTFIFVNKKKSEEIFSFHIVVNKYTMRTGHFFTYWL